MKVAIVSDIHDNIWSLEDTLSRISDCDLLLVLGDIVAPFSLAQIAKGFAGPVHVVWGNNDGDKVLLVRNATAHDNVTIHGEYADIKVDGVRIAMTHYPAIAAAVAAGGAYDLVCYGHDHARRISVVEGTLVVNPGEVMGRFGVHSHAVYDTESHQALLFEY